MNIIEKLLKRIKGLTDAIERYPLTSAFLLAAAIVNAADISRETNHPVYIMTFVVGAFLAAVSQIIYERYFSNLSVRISLMGAAAVLATGYYLIISPAPTLSLEISIRTSVALFALFVAFIWIPVIKNSVSFNESFLISFKSFFIAIFFSGVIFAGISIIIGAIDQLLFPVHYTAYSHTANIVFTLFAPMFFLSLVPVYPGESDKNRTPELIEKNREIIKTMGEYPKLLDRLISYVIIPLVAVFTIILIIYIILNIRSEFWNDNLLEPMLVAYSTTVILVYTLASRLENKFAVLYKKIFPKILVPIVIFQIVSSVLSLRNTGITHGRYYAILFGVFAAVAGVVLSIVPVRKNGIIAALLIIFSLVSIIPPIDAFTISRSSQIGIVEEVMIKNDMLENNIVTPNPSLSNEDKLKIINSMNYLSMMDYTESIVWLPEDFVMYQDFEETFGFKEYDLPGSLKESVYLTTGPEQVIAISGYDYFIQTNFSIPERDTTLSISDIQKNEKEYSLTGSTSKDSFDLILKDENNSELVSFSTIEIFEKFFNYYSVENTIPVEEATFTKENDLAKITVVVQDLFINKMTTTNSYGGSIYILITIK